MSTQSVLPDYTSSSAAGSTPDFGASLDSGATVADSSGGGMALSGLSDIFSSVGTVFNSVYKTLNPPTPGQLVLNPQTGQYVPAGIPQTLAPGAAVYNPATGQYVTAPGTVAGISGNTLLLVGAAVLLIVLLKR